MIANKDELKKLIESNLLELVGIRSDTNSEFERNIEKFYKKWFGKVEYFKNNPENYGFFEIQGDYLGRKIPWCLLKGKGNDTVVFINHYDCVETGNYGLLEPVCLKPYELEEAFKNKGIELPDSVADDLQSNEWLFGRGLADMKGGIAIQLALFEEYSKGDNFNGNIVFISVPDEENLSAGMRSGILKLKELKNKYDFDYKLMLNSEPHERENKTKPVFYNGSIGKIMPVVYVRGKQTHIGYVYKGFNPINLLSEIIRKTELNTRFIEKKGNTIAPAPTWLYSKDRKTAYDVSMPEAACGYMSILSLEKTPMELMKELKEISIKAFKTVIKDLNESYKKYTSMLGIEYETIKIEPEVLFYSELYEKAMRDSGEKFEHAYLGIMEEVKKGFNKNEISMIDAANIIIEKTLDFIKDTEPCVVLALTPPYYPSVNNNMLGEKSKKIDEVTEYVKNYSKKKFNQGITVQSYFTGISDLSYAMFVSNQKDVDYIENNMLMWKDIYYIPLEEIKEISMPVINIGPWGEDIHKYTERVYKEDLYYKTPELIDLFLSKLIGE